jgi:hypothetical protein
MVIDACRDDTKAASLADYLPEIIGILSAKEKLIKLLEETDSYEVSFILDGLNKVGAIQEPEVVAIWKRRLAADQEQKFWFFAKYALLAHFHDAPEVRTAVWRDVETPGYDISTYYSVYANDAEFRPLFEQFLQAADEPLRLAIVQELYPWGLRQDSFALQVLGQYVKECDPQVKTAAARRYYTCVKKTHLDVQPFVDRLKVEMNSVGMDFDFHRQAAISGLLILGRAEMLSDESIKRQDGKLPTFSIHAESEVNWEFIRVLVESWDSLIAANGPEIWKRFHSSDVIVRELFRAGKRHSAKELIADRLDEIRRQAAIDTDSFVALSLLEGGLASFKELTLTILGKLVRVPGNTSPINWTPRDTEVRFEAAKFLATNYAGDSEVGAELVRIAKLSVEGSAAVTALCCSWPDEPYLKELWENIKRLGVDDSPVSARLMALFGTPAEVARYITTLPQLFQRDNFGRYPREAIRAVRGRLTTDVETRRELLVLLQTTEDGDVLASTFRLLGMTEEDILTLREAGSKKIEALRASAKGQMQPMGFDMMTGQVRPIEFSILEACLTK